MPKMPKDFDLINKQIQQARTQAYAVTQYALQFMPNPPGMVPPKEVQRFTKDQLRQLKGGY